MTMDHMLPPGLKSCAAPRRGTVDYSVSVVSGGFTVPHIKQFEYRLCMVHTKLQQQPFNLA